MEYLLQSRTNSNAIFLAYLEISVDELIVLIRRNSLVVD